MELIRELNQKLNELVTLTKMAETYGSKYAHAENDYKIELSKEVLRLKDSNMAATLINLVVYGRPDVSKKRLERDLAEVMYNANQEKINATKLYIKILEGQIKLDYYEHD